MPGLAELDAAAALVHRSITPTAQICWPLLSERCGCEVWVKHENHTADRLVQGAGRVGLHGRDQTA